MKYAVIKVSNGNYAIHSEGWVNLEKAIVDFLGLARTLHNAPDVQTACCMIIDENLDNVQGYKEFINHVKTETTKE